MQPETTFAVEPQLQEGAVRSLAPAALLADQRGVALILTLSMLVILSILGALAISTATTELGISGNYRISRNAFFAAERAVEYSMGNGDIVYNTVDVDLDAIPHDSRLARENSKLLKTNNPSGNWARNLGPGDLPAKLAAKYSNDFGAVYYLIQVTGTGPNDRSKARLETMRVRLYQKDDDSKLITTGGG